MALATNTTPGEIQLAGDLAGNNDATAPELTDLGIAAGQYQYPQVTIDTKGRVTAIASGNPTTLSSLLLPATNTSTGVMQAGLGLSVNTNANNGYQDISFSTIIDGTEISGLDSCATYELTISVDFGTPQAITIVDVPVSTINEINTQLSSQIIGATANVVNGKIRIISDTTGRNSLVEINDDKIFRCVNGFVSINIATKGLASCELNADIASNSQLGVVKIGSGFNIDGAGTLSTNIASPTALGMIQVGTGLTVDVAGVLAAEVVPDATTSSKGLVQIGTGIDVSAGIISSSLATNTTVGVVKSANTDNITITTGDIDIGQNVALLNVSNNWTTAQTVVPVALISGANISTDVSLSNNFTLILGQNTILDNPTNLVAGGKYTFVITQDAVGSKAMNFGTAFKFKSGSDNILSITADAVDILTCVSDGINLYCSLAKEFV